MINCLFCGKENEYMNFCDGDCHKNWFFANGGVKYCPTGGEPTVFTCDGLALEAEHAYHKDYICPIEIISDNSNVIELHSVIYTDGCIVLTIYEHCYALWRRSGEFLGGILWDKSHKIKDVDKLKNLFDKRMEEQISHYAKLLDMVKG